jgi:hypothetical protein
MFLQFLLLARKSFTELRPLFSKCLISRFMPHITLLYLHLPLLTIPLNFIGPGDSFANCLTSPCYKFGFVCTRRVILSLSLSSLSLFLSFFLFFFLSFSFSFFLSLFLSFFLNISKFHLLLFNIFSIQIKMLFRSIQINALDRNPQHFLRNTYDRDALSSQRNFGKSPSSIKFAKKIKRKLLFSNF